MPIKKFFWVGMPVCQGQVERSTQGPIFRLGFVLRVGDDGSRRENLVTQDPAPKMIPPPG